ncbi:hypothetical protein [Sphingomonas sp. CCH5-D11]|uniref:hypothetical protein n=1 Tax=Sphingomonas sp. CCH5-D11 TaxID=1768786 RepID=UPI000ADEA525|nr:hypothetical protein [Sphingomonas sp. CCH5-D11]
MNRICVPVAMATAALAVPLAAQTPPGTFGRSTQMMTQTDRSRQMAQCALRLNRGAAQRYVLASSTDPAERKSMNAFRQSMITCLSGSRSATLDPVAVEGAIAEALLTENGGALLAKAATVPPTTPVRVVLSPNASMHHGVIDCAVRARPDLAAQMLRAQPETPEELQHFQALGPALQACVPQDVKLSIKPFHVRSLVAGALYRRVTSAVTAGQSTGRNNAQA